MAGKRKRDSDASGWRNFAMRGGASSKVQIACKSTFANCKDVGMVHISCQMSFFCELTLWDVLHFKCCLALVPTVTMVKHTCHVNVVSLCHLECWQPHPLDSCLDFPHFSRLCLWCGRREAVESQANAKTHCGLAMPSWSSKLYFWKNFFGLERSRIYKVSWATKWEHH